jgi:hypothetical protein
VDDDCPDDEAAADTVVCRAPVGACDAPDYCDGSDFECPEDELLDGDICRDLQCDQDSIDNDTCCDVEEYCDGESVECPVDEFTPADDEYECREADEDCDKEEYCNGTQPTCPVDSVHNSSFLCRSRAGDCDLPESCDGISKTCPSDEIRMADKRCRRAAGVCDVPEFCDGVSTECPVNAFEPATTVCNASEGGCDPAELCTGAAAACPEDVISGDGEFCRDRDDESCDLAETCNGTSVACPPDTYVAEDTVCDDLDPATTGETCVDGFCGCDGGDVDGDATFDNCDDDEGVLVVQYLKMKFSWLSRLGSFVSKGTFPVGVMADSAADVFDATGGLNVTLYAANTDGAVTIDASMNFTADQCSITRSGASLCKLPSRGGSALFKPVLNEDKTAIVSYKYKIKLKEINIPTVAEAPVILGLKTRGIDRKLELPICAPKGRRGLLCQ